MRFLSFHVNGEHNDNVCVLAGFTMRELLHAMRSGWLPLLRIISSLSTCCERVVCEDVKKPLHSIGILVGIVTMVPVARLEKNWVVRFIPRRNCTMPKSCDSLT